MSDSRFPMAKGLDARTQGGRSHLAVLKILFATQKVVLHDPTLKNRRLNRRL